MIPFDLDSAKQQSHGPLAGMFRGDAQPAKALFSNRDDETLGNPFGSHAHGRRLVEETLDRAASNYRDGEVTGVELVATNASGDLAYVAEVERGKAKVAGR
jgi:hypothetical protein